MGILQQAYGGVFVDLGFVNEEGIQFAYAWMLKLEQADYSKADWLQTAMRRNYFISDVLLELGRFPQCPLIHEHSP